MSGSTAHQGMEREKIDPGIRNILRNKQNNQTSTGKPESKHGSSEEKQKPMLPNMRKSIDRTELDDAGLLAQKKGIKAEVDLPSPLRQIIQTKEEEYRQSKPFSKKYGQQNTTNSKKMQTPQPKTDEKPTQPQPKNKTKESFNKKLNNNIIKDQQTPSSKHSYRIKKIDARSPKKIRDDLIVLNEEEYKLQMQILELHKTTKQQLDEARQTYKFQGNNIGKYFPEAVGAEELNVEQFIVKVGERLHAKKKQLAKLEAKIESNAYLKYIANLPEDIMELHSSEEEDEVQELPDNRPRLENNIGSYATAMPGLKDKKHGLNLRRTYDIFKEDQRQSRVTEQPQDVKEDGENKMTINSKLKDFLLS